MAASPSRAATLTLDSDTVTATAFTDTATGAILSVDHGNTLTLSGVTIDGGPGATGMVENSGTISVAGTLSVEDLTLTGGGIVTLAGGTITGANGSSLTNENNTIYSSGVSTIGSGAPNILNFVNDTAGTIEVTGGTLTIKIDSQIVNHGTLEAVGTASQHATLQINVGSILNTGHIDILADGTLALNNPLTVTGGVTTGGLTLTGGGTVSMSGGTIAAAQSGETLNNVDNTIIGYGQIGTGSGSGIRLNIDNQTDGTIEASGVGDTLTIENFGGFNNAGILEAAAGATLQIHASTITNSGSITVDGTLAVDNPAEFRCDADARWHRHDDTQRRHDQ